ncbi:hypothetical protein [Pedobacter flavus]|uniref:Uncharacterized protein n=1 Tax=Pedobacter flavus TaxID=3113906 RepID=A0ABU7H063_9SPHI|nr:hypothetical protein [Pedobacter sp. VNH31]MEE1883936.1 hypothetical protein [Pedobacter sp. VNH31]
MILNKINKFLFTTSILLFVALHSNAQCDPMFDPFCEDVDVPIDDWIPYIVLGIAVISYFFFKNKKIIQTAS